MCGSVLSASSLHVLPVTYACIDDCSLVWLRYCDTCVLLDSCCDRRFVTYHDISCGSL